MTTLPSTTVIHSSGGQVPPTPAQQGPFIEPARLAAMRLATQRLAREAYAAGLYPDGRIRDMAVYAAHLRGQK